MFLRFVWFSQQFFDFAFVIRGTCVRGSSTIGRRSPARSAANEEMRGMGVNGCDEPMGHQSQQTAREIGPNVVELEGSESWPIHRRDLIRPSRVGGHRRRTHIGPCWFPVSLPAIAVVDQYPPLPSPHRLRSPQSPSPLPIPTHKCSRL